MQLLSQYFGGQKGEKVPKTTGKHVHLYESHLNFTLQRKAGGFSILKSFFYKSMGKGKQIDLQVGRNF